MRQDALRVGLLVGALCIWSCTQGRAADPGPYLSLDAGFNIANDVDLAGGATMELDPGFRFSVAGGYRFTPMISAEIETGFLGNEVDQIAGFDVDDTVLSYAPFLANVVFRFENSSPFIPFVGAGVGGVASFFEMDDLGLDDDDSDFVFAWQVLAGVHYRINDNMSAGIVYKYLGADSPEFEIDGAAFELDVVNNHAIMGSFNWSF